MLFAAVLLGGIGIATLGMIRASELREGMIMESRAELVSAEIRPYVVAGKPVLIESAGTDVVLRGGRLLVRVGGYAVESPLPLLYEYVDSSASSKILLEREGDRVFLGGSF